jgi:hypothetical protein
MIINTPLGPNSFKFDFDSSATVADMITAMDTEIINNHGWTKYDTLDILATDAAIVYRALNLDGTYKYVKLRLSSDGTLVPSGWYGIQIAVYQDWNATTHVGTNVCYRSDVKYGKAPIGFNGQIYLFINDRWFACAARRLDIASSAGLNYTTSAAHAAETTVSINPMGGIFGCFEITRDQPEDAASPSVDVPAFCYTHVNMISDSSAGYSSQYTGGWFYSSYCCGSLPKLKSGEVGAAATMGMNTLWTPVTGASSYNSLGPFYMDAKSSFSDEYLVTVINAYEKDIVLKGRILGIKAYSKYTNTAFLDIVPIKVDSNYLPSSSGTLTDHLIIPLYDNTQYCTVLIPK